ncbi:MAG: SMP-30/gluconolactonase/LRE family protein [Pseudomonadota bacterium]
MDKLCSGYGLVEGPVWDQTRRALLFSDVLNGGVFSVTRDGRVETVIEHRRGIGGMALHVHGGMVVSGRNVSWKPFSTDVGGETVMLLDRDESAGNVGYNDLTTDEQGRIYVGSLGSSPVFEDGREPASGDLYLIDTDGMARIVMEDIRLTNGLAVSPDGKTLYHSDTTRNVVNRYTVQPDGALSDREIFVHTHNGVPDGLCVSADGAVWVALAGGGSGVQAYSEDGRELMFVEIPQPMCTSCCFGGDDLNDLYIVSGSDGGEPNSGAVYVERLDHTGLVVHPAAVQLAAGGS